MVQSWKRLIARRQEFEFKKRFAIVLKIGVLWRPLFCRGFCQTGYLAPENWEASTRNTRTPFSMICKHCLWKGDTSDNYNNFSLSSHSHFLSIQMYWANSTLFHIGIWLFFFSHLLAFLCYLASLYQVLGSYGGHFSCRGFCQLFYFAPSNWEPPLRNAKTPVSIMCNPCFWKGELSESYIYFFSSFDSLLSF